MSLQNTSDISTNSNLDSMDHKSINLSQRSFSNNNNKNTVSTPIRPRPILASAFSFDSGFEVSPICLNSFHYGESMPSSTSMISINNQINNENSDENMLTQEEIEGIDEELISIDQHFTPIHSPNVETQSTDRKPFNLAMQRHRNRLKEFNGMEINNNDNDFPNAYDQYDGPFDLDDDDDEVFFDYSGEDSSTKSLSPPSVPEQHRPSCVMMYGGDGHKPQSTMDDNEDDETTMENDFNFSLSSSSRSSSTPIPIPGANQRRHSFQPFVANLDGNNDDVVDGNSLVSGYSYPEYPEFSLPNGRRLPYYHRMAPRLDRMETNSLLMETNQSSIPISMMVNNPEQEQPSSTSSSLSNQRGNASSKFGSKLQIGFSIINNNLNQSCYSPPPYFNKPLPNGFLFRFGRLETNRFITSQQQQDYNNHWQKIFGDIHGSLFKSGMLTSISEVNENENDDEMSVWDRTESPSLQFPMSPGSDCLTEDLENESNINEDSSLPPVQLVSNDFQQSNSLQMDRSRLKMMDVDVIPSMDRGQYPCSTCRCGCRSCCTSTPPIYEMDASSIVESNIETSTTTQLPDVVFNCDQFSQSSPTPPPIKSPERRPIRRLKRSNTEKSTLPSNQHHQYNSQTSNDNHGANHYGNNGQMERRPMSVSLPIDQETMSVLGNQLRQISNEFQTLQLQRSNLYRRRVMANKLNASNSHTAANFIRSVLELLTLSSANNNSQRRQSPPSSLPNVHQVNNSIFYTGQSAPPNTPNEDKKNNSKTI